MFVKRAFPQAVTTSLSGSWVLTLLLVSGCSGPTVVPVNGFVVPETAVVVDLSYPLTSQSAEAISSAPAPSPGDLPRTLTRFEAPAASVPGGAPVDRVLPGRLVGPAVVVDVAPRVEVDDEYLLSVDDLVRWEGRNGPIPPGAIIIMRSGWGARWGRTEDRGGQARGLFENRDVAGVTHFPGLSPGAARRLAAMKDVLGVGVDTPDVGGSHGEKAAEARKALHGAGCFALSGLARLERLPERGAIVIIAPLPVQGAREAPARVLALVPRS